MLIEKSSEGPINLCRRPDWLVRRGNGSSVTSDHRQVARGGYRLERS